jgi:membrane protein involved in colicin uptake
MEPMHPDDVDELANAEKQVTSAEAAERAAQQAEHVDVGRGGSGDSPLEWSTVHHQGRRDEGEAVQPRAKGVAAGGEPSLDDDESPGNGPEGAGADEHQPER